MSFNQTKYINNYNKKNYKLYQFRVKKENKDLIEKLDHQTNRNNIIMQLIEEYYFHYTVTIKQIKEKVIPIFEKYDIHEIYLFGSYARGEANKDSDIDLYTEKGTIKNLLQMTELINKLEEALKKKVDLIFTTSKIDDNFKMQVDKDKIRLC